jgi:hypothetical protein
VDTFLDVLTLPQVYVLAILGFIAFSLACSIGARTGWLTYHSILCGAVGGLFGFLVGVVTALI